MQVSYSTGSLGSDPVLYDNILYTCGVVHLNEEQLLVFVPCGLVYSRSASFSPASSPRRRPLTSNYLLPSAFTVYSCDISTSSFQANLCTSSASLFQLIFGTTTLLSTSRASEGDFAIVFVDFGLTSPRLCTHFRLYDLACKLYKVGIATISDRRLRQHFNLSPLRCRSNLTSPRRRKQLEAYASGPSHCHQPCTMGLPQTLIIRDNLTSHTTALTPLMVNLLIALLSLILVVLITVGALLYLRRRRRINEAGLPMYDEPMYNYNEKASKEFNHRRLTITTGSSRHSRAIHVYNEKQNLVENSSSPPTSPDSVPEIRITFPDEQDEAGRRKSGRVVIVRVGDNGLGLEPFDENLPPYQSSDNGRLQSLDLNRR